MYADALSIEEPDAAGYNVVLPYNPSLPLHDFVYGDAKKQLVAVMIHAEDSRAMQENCAKLCRSIHQLFESLRAMQSGDRKIDAKVRMHLLISNISMLVSLIVADVISMAAIQLQLATDHKGRYPDRGTLAHDLRYANILLQCCMDAIDHMIDQEPTSTIGICSQEGIPLMISGDENPRVHRLTLQWDYCMAPQDNRVSVEDFRLRTRKQQELLLAS